MQLFKNILLCLCLFFTVTLSANEVDSLKTLLPLTPHGWQRYVILLQLVNQYTDEYEETVYLQQLVEEAHRLDSVNLECSAMVNLARNYYNRVIEDSMHIWTERVIPLASKHKFYQYMFDAYSYECYLDIYTRRFESAMDKSEEMYNLAKELNSMDGLITSYENMGQIYQQTERHAEALKAFKQGLKLQQQMGNRYGYQAQFMFNIIESSIEIMDFNDAYHYLIEVRKIVDNFEENKYADERGFPVERCRWLIHCLYINMYVKENKFQLAKREIREAEKYANVNDYYVKCYYYEACADYYRSIKQYDKALEYLDKAIDIDKEAGHLIKRAEILAELGKYSASVKQYKEAIRFRDSVSNENFAYQMNDLSTRHEVYRLESQAKKMKQATKQYQLQVMYGSIVFLLVLLLAVTWFLLRTRRLKNKLLDSDKQLRKEKAALIESEKELIIARDKAEESSRLKTAFLQNMSHEIRTPLNSVVGFSNVIAEKYNTEEDRQMTNIIKTNSGLLLKLVNDVLDISRLESERMQFTFAKCNLYECCRNAAMNVMGLVKPGVILHYPFADNPLFIKTDGLRLQQLLINLLTNAAKFTEKGEIKLSYQVLEAEDCVQISVTDTGCGVPPEMEEAIFTRFTKLDEFAQGTGLGLPITRMIAEHLKGTVILDTTYTAGARFIVTLPINPEV